VERGGMTRKRFSIGQVMVFIALAGVNLAVARGVPPEIYRYPTIWVVVGIFDFLIVWKLIRRRDFHAFLYTFLIVFFISYTVFANLVATERIQPLGPLVRWYKQLVNQPFDIRSLAGLISMAEIWSTVISGALLASALGLIARWLERRRGWDIAAFWRGALIGILVASVLATIDDWAHGWALEPYSFQWKIRMLLLVAALFMGGLFGLAKLKSKRAASEPEIEWHC
jgi:uncharacterized membrane-anchored protein YitT (DUF2179 family)